MPLTPAWLRFHLLRRSKAGDGVAETHGRFALVETRLPMPALAVVAPAAAQAHPVPPRGVRITLLGAIHRGSGRPHTGAKLSNCEECLGQAPAHLGRSRASVRQGRRPGDFRARPATRGLRKRIVQDSPLRGPYDGRFVLTNRWLRHQDTWRRRGCLTVAAHSC